ncbi:MAG: glycosyltransferase [Dehalococcoidales bacterium]|jgi:glycosyltransferase involved in cell wall biosynthesis
MKGKPLVSIVMSVYNSEQYLMDAIDSILAQTFGEFEFIIIDDGSTDGSIEILNRYKKNDARMKVYRLSQNVGIVEALNRGVKLTTGKYIARMDADDISLPERLERQLAFLDSNPEVGVLGTNIQLIDTAGKKYETLKFPTSHTQILWSLCFYNPIVHPSVMIKRDILIRTNGYRSGYPCAEDYDLWTRLAGETRFANLSQILLLLRKHTTNITIMDGFNNLISSIQIGRRMLNQILDKDVSKETVEILWDPKYCLPDEIEQTTKLLVELFDKFISRYNPSESERLFIRQDLAKRLTSLALRRISTRTMSTILKAYSYSPTTVLNILIWGILRKTKRMVFE